MDDEATVAEAPVRPTSLSCTLDPSNSHQDFVRVAATLGPDEVRHVRGTTYKDKSTVIVVPMRGAENHLHDKDCRSGDHRNCYTPHVRLEVMQSWVRLMQPMNAKRAMVFSTGHEVGKAYDAMIQEVLDDPLLSTYKYILSLEDDNLPPKDAHLRLLDTIESGPWDAVAGLYWMKNEYSTPMAYGDPTKLDPEMDFAPVDVSGGGVIEVNCLPQGCTLYRTDLFRDIGPPWFVTVNEIQDGVPVQATQDVTFCERSRRKGKRFAVDCNVLVSHMDTSTGELY
jgi:hypothetical protein